MRQSETPYVVAGRVINAWLRGDPVDPVINEAPDYLRDLIRYSARQSCGLILHWAKQAASVAEGEYDGTDIVPDRLRAQVQQYISNRAG